MRNYLSLSAIFFYRLDHNFSSSKPGYNYIVKQFHGTAFHRYRAVASQPTDLQHRYIKNIMSSTFQIIYISVRCNKKDMMA